MDLKAVKHIKKNCQDGLFCIRNNGRISVRSSVRLSERTLNSESLFLEEIRTNNKNEIEQPND